MGDYSESHPVIVKNRVSAAFGIHEPASDRICGMVQQEIPEAWAAFSKSLQIDTVPGGPLSKRAGALYPLESIAGRARGRPGWIG